MENHQTLPFERNRYYVGKLLTSADFQTEQNYFNNKRRFINSLMLGEGVVCGLSVYSLDDLSIMVESGVAIDGLGREIVVENSVVSKLSAINGFDELSSDDATLCLRYREEAVRPVYSVTQQQQGEEYELNHLREGWELFLVDTELMEAAPKVESEFLNQVVLYSGKDYSVTVSMPATVCFGTSVRLTVCVEKLSSAEKDFSLGCVFQMPAFADRNGEHELTVNLNSINLQHGERFYGEYWLTARKQETCESIIMVRPNSAKLLVGGEEFSLEEHFLLKVLFTDLSVNDLVVREIGKVNLEMRRLSAARDFIPLAHLLLQSSQNAYIIDTVSEEAVKRYIPMAAEDALRREYTACFGGGGVQLSGPAKGQMELDSGRPAPQRDTVYATGTCEIPLGDSARRGDVVISDEIMHGLGKGNVQVQVGFEYLAKDARLDATARNTIYGDPTLFDEEKPPVVCAQTAVKVMNDRGSFMVAARLQRDTPYVVLLLRWIAVRIPADDGQMAMQRIAGKNISAVQPTVLLGTRESCYFNVRFHNMEPCGLSYELMEKDSGTITTDGIYTAPAREGVYEIMIYCSEQPIIATYAYAIVRKSAKESEAQPKT